MSSWGLGVKPSITFYKGKEEEGREGLKVLECSRMEENHLAYDRIVLER